MSSLGDVGARLLRNRALVRAPIWLYRVGLGVVFGHRLLMVEHRGRTSGLPRYVVLEVVDRPTPGSYIIVSGFGERAQWYRNVLADPRVRVSVGSRRRLPATAHPLAAEAADATLQRYAAEHPRAWARLRDTLQSAQHTETPHLPMIRLDLSEAAT